MPVGPPGAPPAEGADADALLGALRRAEQRAARHARDGEPTLMRQLAAVGVLGWIVVVPALGGLWAGRWLDRLAGGTPPGHLWTGALLMAGLGLGCWSAWRWMHGR